MQTERWGEVKLGIAFGDVFCAVVSVEQLGIEITPQYTADLVEAGMAIKRAANEAFGLKHPDVPSID